MSDETKEMDVVKYEIDSSISDNIPDVNFTFEDLQQKPSEVDKIVNHAIVEAKEEEKEEKEEKEESKEDPKIKEDPQNQFDGMYNDFVNNPKEEDSTNYSLLTYNVLIGIDKKLTSSLCLYISVAVWISVVVTLSAAFGVAVGFGFLLEIQENKILYLTIGFTGSTLVAFIVLFALFVILRALYFQIKAKMQKSNDNPYKML